MDNATLAARDLKTVWHPCTQMKDHEHLPLIPIKRAQGVWLEDFDGNRYIDGISSWWVNIFGHANPEISNAIAQQAQTLEHVILAGFSHQPVIELSERLVKMTPEGLTRCQYADSGSAAIEIAMKMSFQYWQNRGYKNKTRFVSLTNSYHGETLGALSAGQVDLYKEIYRPLLLDVVAVPSPDCFGKDESEWETHSKTMFARMRETLESMADQTCAVIVEPLVQCAGNMRMYHPAYLRLLRETCTELGIHLIADEIAVGFGRTGTMFACEQAGITPDMLCLGKGLTGGYLPLSVCLTTEEIYDAFYDDYESLKGFLHSHSYTGNALSCAAALATMELFETGDVLTRNRETAKLMSASVEALGDHPHVAEVRQTGMILAIEMIRDKSAGEPYPWTERRGMRVYRHALANNVLLRPLGNVVYFMPPYVINGDEIRQLAKVAIEGIELATAD